MLKYSKKKKLISLYFSFTLVLLWIKLLWEIVLHRLTFITFKCKYLIYQLIENINKIITKKIILFVKYSEKNIYILLYFSSTLVLLLIKSFTAQ